MIRHGDILITPSLFELDEIVNGRRYVGVTIARNNYEGRGTPGIAVFECIYCHKVLALPPKHCEKYKCHCHAHCNR